MYSDSVTRKTLCPSTRRRSHRGSSRLTAGARPARGCSARPSNTIAKYAARHNTRPVGESTNGRPAVTGAGEGEGCRVSVRRWGGDPSRGEGHVSLHLLGFRSHPSLRVAPYDSCI